MSTFEMAVRLRRLSEQTALDAEVITGTVSITKEAADCLTSLQDLVRDISINGNSCSSDQLKTRIGESAEFEISIPSGTAAGGYFVRNLDHLFNRQQHCKEMPERFYLYDTDVLYPEEEFELATQYEQATGLASLLELISHFSIDGEISFVSPIRVDFVFKFREVDLRNAQLQSIERLKKELTPEDPDPHTERRTEIFVSVVSEHLKSSFKDQRFSYLVRHLDEIYRDYRQDYSIYAKGFSFANLMSELDEQRSKQFGRLNEVIHGVSAKLLSIPVAYVLIAGQLAHDQTMKNHIIFLGAFVFAFLILLMIGFQVLTVRHIGQDIKNLKASYGGRLSEEEINSKLDQLEVRLLFHYVFFTVIAAIVVGVFVLIAYLYDGYTDSSIIERIYSLAQQTLLRVWSAVQEILQMLGLAFG